MPDKEKVITHFRDAIEASGCDNKWRFVRVDILEEAIALLKEQETSYRNCGDDIYDDEIVTKWKCNACGNIVYGKCTSKLMFRYCSNCGRAVKWDD